MASAKIDSEDILCHILSMIGIACIIGTSGINILFPINPELLPLAKFGFGCGCFMIFMAEFGK